MDIYLKVSYKSENASHGTSQAVRFNLKEP